MNDKCPNCNGTGYVTLFTSRETCKRCGGTGLENMPVNSAKFAFNVENVEAAVYCTDEMERFVAGIPRLTFELSGILKKL